MIQEQLDEIEIGSVCAGMHMHQTNYGALKGWDVGQLFEIPKEAAQGLLRGLPNAPSAFTNKLAFVVSVTNDNIKNVPSVLVVYLYDRTYYMTTLTNHMA